MKTVIASVAILAASAATAFADQLPLNSTVSGGQGVVSADGQALAIGGALGGGTIVAIAVIGTILVVTIANDDGTVSTVTTTI